MALVTGLIITEELVTTEWFASKLGEQVKLRDISGSVQLTLDSDGDIDCMTIQSSTIACTGLTVATQKTGGTTNASISSAGMLTVENINMENFPTLP